MGTVVECHSGHTYAERPKAFYWGAERLVIEDVEAEWRTPDAKHFRVKAKTGNIFDLVYNQARDEWQISKA